MSTGISDFENKVKTSNNNSLNNVSFFENEISSVNTQLNQTLNDTMRTFKDQMSFNLQSLNLTLSTLSSSMNNLGSKISGLSPNVAGRYIEANTNPGTFLGPLSREYVNAQNAMFGDVSPVLGNSAFTHRPYNVNPLEYYTGAQMQRDLYSSKFLSNAASKIAAAITPGQTLGTLVLSSLWNGTHNYMNTGDMIRRMSGRFSSSPMSLNSSLSVARGLQKLAHEEVMQSTFMDNRLGNAGYNDIVGLGLQMDLFKGTTPEQLLTQVKEAGKVVKLLTGVLAAKDVKDAMEAIGQIKNMGINLTRPGGKNFANELATQSYGYGFINSISSNQMLTTGLQIAQSGYGTNGIPAAIGVLPAMQNLALVNEMRKRGLISDTAISASGGVNTMAAGMLGAVGGFYNSSAGFAMLAAGMRNGVLNPSITNALLAGENGIGNSIGSGLRNLFSGPGMFVNYARARVDMPNMLAQAGANNPEALMETFKLWNMNAIRLMPQFRRGSMEDKKWLLADYLMQNQGMTSGSAQASAMDWLDPSIRQDTNYLAKMGILRGEADKSLIYGSTGADLNRIAIEPLERATEQVSEHITSIGRWITDYGKRRQFYRDPASDLNYGRSLLYSNIDKNGKKTPGVLHYRPDESLKSLFSFKNINDLKNNYYLYDIEDQDIRAIDMYNDPTSIVGGLKRGFMGGWNAMLKLARISKYSRDEDIASMRFGLSYANAYNPILKTIQDGSGWNTVELNAAFKEGSNGLAKNLSTNRIKELGDKYQNSPFAYGIALAMEAGYKGQGNATMDWDEMASDPLVQQAVNTYLNANPIGREDPAIYIQKLFSSILNGEGLKNTNIRQKIIKELYNNPRFKPIESAEGQRKKLNDVLQSMATEKGYSIISGAASNSFGTKNWQIGDLIRNTSGDMANILSDKDHDTWEKAKNAGLNKNILDLIEIVNAYNEENPNNKITFGDMALENLSGESSFYQNILAPKLGIDKKQTEQEKAQAKRVRDTIADLKKLNKNIDGSLRDGADPLKLLPELNEKEKIRAIYSPLASASNGGLTYADFITGMGSLWKRDRKGRIVESENAKKYAKIEDRISYFFAKDLLEQGELGNYEKSLSTEQQTKIKSIIDRANDLAEEINSKRKGKTRFTGGLIADFDARAKYMENEGISLTNEELNSMNNIQKDMLEATSGIVVKERFADLSTKQQQNKLLDVAKSDASKNPVAKAMILHKGNYCLRTIAESEIDYTKYEESTVGTFLRDQMQKAADKDDNKINNNLAKLSLAPTLSDYMDEAITRANTLPPKLKYTRRE